MSGDHEDLIRALANHTADREDAVVVFDMLRASKLERDLAIRYAEALDLGGWLAKETPFAQIAKSVRRALQGCPRCYLLYGYLVETQIDHRKPAAGIRPIAKEFGWDKETVSIHAKHLDEDHRFIARDRDGQNQLVLRVLHHPARGRFNLLPGADMYGFSVHPCTEPPDAVSGDSVHRSPLLSPLAQVSEASSRENGHREAEQQESEDAAADDDGAFVDAPPGAVAVVNVDEQVPGWVYEQDDDSGSGPTARKRGQGRDDDEFDVRIGVFVDANPPHVRPCDVERHIGDKRPGGLTVNGRLARLARRGRIVKLAKGLYGPRPVSPGEAMHTASKEDTR